MVIVNGTQGYAEVAERFINLADAVDFAELHRSYLTLIPSQPGHILDVGAGSGRDAAEFARMGHEVVAVEPTLEFRLAAQRMHTSSNIEWLDDALPFLEKLDNMQFNFVLASGVWHHLNDLERRLALERISALMMSGAFFAVSLRNGPAGAGTHVFPTDAQQTVDEASSYGLTEQVRLVDQPSMMKGKENVKWAYLAFQKT